jgi:hypothetical protein
VEKKPSTPAGTASLGRRESEADLEAVGLERAASDSPSPVMREFARIAIAHRLTLGGLARRLNQRDGTKLKAVNVSRHFASGQPRELTVISYAAVLGVSKSYLGFLSGELIPRPDVEEALRRAIELTRALIVKTLKEDPGEAAEWARAFALAQMRQEAGITDDRAAKHESAAAVIGIQLTALADRLGPRVGLLSALGEDIRLVTLQSALLQVFSKDSGDDVAHVIAFVMRLLRSRDIDTSAMEAALERVSRTWRIGDLTRHDYSMDLTEET